MPKTGHIIKSFASLSKYLTEQQAAIANNRTMKKMKKIRPRIYRSDEEVARIVGGYRLTDGYQQDYAEARGLEKNTLSWMIKRARNTDLRGKFPQLFGDIGGPAHPILAAPVAHGDPVDGSFKIAALKKEREDLSLQVDALNGLLAQKEAEIEELYAKLLKSERRLQNAIGLILDK